MASSASLLDPDFLRKLEAVRLAVRSVRWGSQVGGRYVINRRGSSIEFADYAAYAPGDDIRNIDWRLYARLDKLFVKTYREEIELSVEVIVDATASMALPTAKKFERARQLGLCLAYIGLASRHRVRMSYIQPGAMRATPPLSQRAQIKRCATLGDSIHPGGSLEMRAWVPRAISSLKIRGGQALVISDCLYRSADLFAALHLLMRRHLEVRLIQVVTEEELHPARLAQSGVLVDSETGQTHELAYKPEELDRAVRDHHEMLSQFCKRQGILFAQHRLEEAPDQFVLKTLTRLGFLE